MDNDDQISRERKDLRYQFNYRSSIETEGEFVQRVRSSTQGLSTFVSNAANEPQRGCSSLRSWETFFFSLLFVLLTFDLTRSKKGKWKNRKSPVWSLYTDNRSIIESNVSTSARRIFCIEREKFTVIHPLQSFVSSRERSLFRADYAALGRFRLC